MSGARIALSLLFMIAAALLRAETGRSLFLPPSLTHGIWLELREAG